MKKISILFLTFIFSSNVLAWQPTTPVRAIIGYGPGSGNDLVFRKLSDIVSQQNPNVQFIIEYKPGADGTIAMNYLLDQPNNGTVVAVPSFSSIFVANDIWQQNKKFNFDSFVNVLGLGKSPLALVAHLSSGVNTPKEFINLIQHTSNTVNVAVGSGAHHLSFEYVMIKTNASRQRVQAINYKGPVDAVTSVASGQLEFGIVPMAVAQPLVENNKIKIIGITGNKKLSRYPNAELLADVIPGINVQAGWMLSLPPNTSKVIVDWYQREFKKAIDSKNYQEWAEKNYILIADNELTSDGLTESGKKFRKSLEPVIKGLEKN
jgi:tripartite-type tricarboxylate transporter receptor subunit TctC